MWRWLARLWRIVYVLVVGGWLAWILFTSFAANPGAVVGVLKAQAWVFAASWLAMAVGLGLLWSVLVNRRYDVKVGVRASLWLQSRAWLGRYLPGKVGVLLGKMEVVNYRSIGMRQVAASVLFEQAAFVLAGFVAAALLISEPLRLPWFDPEAVDWVAKYWHHVRVVAGIAGGIGFMSLPLLMKAVEGKQNQGGGRVPLLPLLYGYLCTHLLVGLGAVPLVQMLLPEGSEAAGVLGIAGVIALAHVAGIFAVFAPAGLGVREVVFAAAFAGDDSMAAAIAAATLMRLVTLIADAFFLFLGLALAPRQVSN